MQKKVLSSSVVRTLPSIFSLLNCFPHAVSSNSFNSPAYSRCIQVIAPQLRKERFWEIGEELMENLGSAFLMDKTFLVLDLEYEKMCYEKMRKSFTCKREENRI